MILKDKKNKYINAVYQSQEFVKERLKAPSTAEFQNPYQATVSDEGNNTYTIVSWVDAENSFGAHLRLHYNCKLTYTNDGMVKLDYCNIDD